MKNEWKEEQFDKIKQDYYKALENADEKVHLANHIYDLVDRHLRKLDQELSKFKMELEADNAGITEVLEKRSLELDKKPTLNSHKSEKRRLASQQPLMNHSEKRMTTEKVLSSIAQEAAFETLGQRPPTSNSASTSPALTMFKSTSSPALYSLGNVAAGSNSAIAAAASQAIAATQHIMQQGRRTPSMKASFGAAIAARGHDLVKDISSTKDVGYNSQPATPTSQDVIMKSQRSKKQTAKAAQLIQQQQQMSQNSPLPPTSQPVTPQPVIQEASPVVEEINPDLQIVDENGQPVDWQNDPNEPRYCLCNQVSYGDMVGCDNDDCPIEWFHYGCVGLTQAPKGKWFCPQCTAAMKRRGRR